jgi:hypothetical protein
MTTSPTSPRTTTLAESDPSQHAFCHSANTSEEEMEEKEDVNQNLHLNHHLEQCLLNASDIHENRSKSAPARARSRELDGGAEGI